MTGDRRTEFNDNESCSCSGGGNANITVNKQLTVAESAVAQATSHLELTCALVDQAHVAAHEASHAQTATHENSQVRCCDRVWTDLCVTTVLCFTIL